MTEEQQNNDNNGWNSWKIYVIKSLEKLENKQSQMEKEHHEHETCSTKTIAELQTSSKITNAIISTIIAIIVGLLINIGAAFIIHSYIDDENYKQNINTNSSVEETKNQSELK